MKNKKVAITVIAILLAVVIGLLAVVLLLEGNETMQPVPTQSTTEEAEYTTAPIERGPGEYFIPGENEGGLA